MAKKSLSEAHVKIAWLLLCLKFLGSPNYYGYLLVTFFNSLKYNTAVGILFHTTYSTQNQKDLLKKHPLLIVVLIFQHTNLWVTSICKFSMCISIDFDKKCYWIFYVSKYTMFILEIEGVPYILTGQVLFLKPLRTWES